MSVIRANRAQSAYNRPLRRSATTIEGLPDKKRSTTTMNTYESHANALAVPAWRKMDQGSAIGSQYSWRRPKTSSISTTTSSQVQAEAPQTEIERLLRCLDREDKRIVHVKCLADYRTLADVIDLRSTPFDQKSLCALQQRENRIVQRNACRDKRFHSLLHALTPSNIVGIEQKDSNDINISSVSEYSPIGYPVG